jgi:hypothetical protein
VNLLDREPRVIDGVSVFLDHARDDLVWYLPANPTAASRAAASSPWRWC